MIRFFAAEAVGPRDDQQDAFAFGAHVAVVADGMGGHAEGAEAAQAAVRAVMEELGDDAVEPDVEGAIRFACQEVSAASGGGTTLLVASFDGAGERCHATIAWVGDSRAYVVRDGGAELLTEDHVATDGGLERWVPDEGVPELVRIVLSAGDVLVLCTDGVWNVLDGDEIAELIAEQHDDPAEALVSHAIDEGASDNCTAVICAF